MSSETKELPNVVVLERDEGSEFEFEEVVLAGIEIDTVDSRGLCRDGVRKGIVSSRRNDEHDIVTGDIEDLLVFPRILLPINMASKRVYPGESINVVRKLRVFVEFGIVRNPPETMLIEETWQWEIGFEVYDCLIVCFGMDLYVFSDDIGTQSRSQVRRLGSDCVETFMSIGIPVLFTPEPDIIGDSDDKRNDKSIAAIE